MLENIPLLSICIPTYNRDALLRQCLESIVVQFKDETVKARVEISISDNASGDTTQAVVREFTRLYPNVVYSRNSQNLGFDRNLLKAIGNARGQYCWLLGDDDALFEDALSHMLPKLEGGRFDYSLVNCWGYDHQLRYPALGAPNMNLASDQQYAHLSDFVKKIPDYRDRVGFFGGMSCQIVKREVWENFPGKEEFLDTQIIHLKTILAGFKDLPALVVAKPMVKARADNMRWDLVPGQETNLKRARATRETALWILRLYNIPYSPWYIFWQYYWGIAYGSLLLFARRYIVRSPKLRAALKKLLNK